MIRERERLEKCKYLIFTLLQPFSLPYHFISPLKGFKFKLKRLTQNPKAELKRFWVGFDSGTK